MEGELRLWIAQALHRELSGLERESLGRSHRICAHIDKGNCKLEIEALRQTQLAQFDH